MKKKNSKKIKEKLELLVKIFTYMYINEYKIYYNAKSLKY